MKKLFTKMKLLAGLGCAAVLVAGVGSTVDAAYPPYYPWSLSVGETTCSYTKSGVATLEDWSFTATYDVKDDGGTIELLDAETLQVIASQAVQGQGTITFGAGGWGLDAGDGFDQYIVGLEVSDAYYDVFPDPCPFVDRREVPGSEPGGNANRTKRGSGRLPSTGADALGLSLAGAALVGGGALMVGVSRRNRARNA